MNKKVKLLIITQKVDQNDDILGFFHQWVREFAENCEKVTVICLQKGEYDLPDNVKVLSLGKEQPSAVSAKDSPLCPQRSVLCSLRAGYRLLIKKSILTTGRRLPDAKRAAPTRSLGRSPAASGATEKVRVGGAIKERIFARLLTTDYWLLITKKLKYILNFYKHIFRERKNYDAVFVHMNPEYVILGAPFWKLWRKKISLWYTHKQVDLKLRLAEKLADKIFSASKESFRLPSKKLKVMGHGIDASQFSIFNFQFSNKNNDDKFRIITVGRIAPTKNLHILIEVAEVLKNKNFPFSLEIAGAPATESDKIYFENLKNTVKEKGMEDKVIFAGSIPHKDIPKFYADGDLFINLSDTGSVDKAVLEAMAAGLLVLTSNEAFKPILSEKYLTENNSEQIAEKIITLSKPEKDKNLREYVLQNNSLENLIKNLIGELNGQTSR